MSPVTFNIPFAALQPSTVPEADLDLTVSPIKYSLDFNFTSKLGKSFSAIILPAELKISILPGVTILSG